MNFKIVLLFVLFLSSISLYSCGKIDNPKKPSEIITKN